MNIKTAAVKTLILALAAAAGLAAAAQAEDFNTASISAAGLKGSREEMGGLPVPGRPALTLPDRSLEIDVKGASEGESFGGGDLGVVARAVEGGCRRAVSILADKSGIKYTAGGKEFASQVIAAGGGNIGHVWVRLVDKTSGVDSYHGHTGELGLDEVNYSRAIRILNDYTFTGNIEDLDPEFADEDNPALYLQHIYSDGKDHGAEPGHAPNFEAAFCVSKEQFERAEIYIAAYDFKHYGGFNSGCGVFALGVFDAAGVGSLDPRFSHVLPEEVSAYGFPIRLVTPGTANYERARTISYVYPDAMADQLGSLAEKAGVYYKSK